MYVLKSFLQHCFDKQHNRPDIMRHVIWRDLKNALILRLKFTQNPNCSIIVYLFRFCELGAFYFTLFCFPSAPAFWNTLLCTAPPAPHPLCLSAQLFHSFSKSAKVGWSWCAFSLKFVFDTKNKNKTFVK